LFNRLFYKKILKTKTLKPVDDIVKRTYGTEKIGWIFSFLIVVMLLTSQGCGDSSGYVNVDLSKTISVERPGSQLSGEPYLKVAVAAMISPKDTFIYYRQILDYLGDQMGRKTQLVQRKTYGEINALFKKGEVDVGFICSGRISINLT
jgi:phosphonate transport system substrate-binding protein